MTSRTSISPQSTIQLSGSEASGESYCVADHLSVADHALIAR
jgi:hypothetical protein